MLLSQTCHTLRSSYRISTIYILLAMRAPAQLHRTTPLAAYFKSTDGHISNWNSNLRRANFHLLRIIMTLKMGKSCKFVRNYLIRFSIIIVDSAGVGNDFQIFCQKQFLFGVQSSIVYSFVDSRCESTTAVGDDDEVGTRTASVLGQWLCRSRRCSSREARI